MEAPTLAQPAEFIGTRMDIVRQYGTTPHQSVFFVNREIVFRPGKQPRDFCDLRGVLVDVRREARTGMFLKQRLADLQHRFRRG